MDGGLGPEGLSVMNEGRPAALLPGAELSAVALQLAGKPCTLSVMGRTACRVRLAQRGLDNVRK